MDTALIDLYCAALVFPGSHLAISSRPLRGRLVGVLGDIPYKLAYSILSIAALAWLIWAYAKAPQVELWGKPGWAHWLAVAVMPFAMILIAGSLRLDNPTLLIYRSGSFNPKHGGIFALTRHPLMWGILLWAVVHIAANGNLASLMFFGSVGILAFLGTFAQDARKRSTDPALWAQISSATSNLPLVALVEGRASLDWRRLVVPVILGLALYVVVLLVHQQAFGGAPVP